MGTDSPRLPLLQAKHSKVRFPRLLFLPPTEYADTLSLPQKSPPPATLSEEHKAALDAAAAAAVPTGPASTPLRAIQQQTGLDLGLATPKTTLFGTHPPATFGPHHVPEPYRDLYRGASNLVQEGLKSMFGSNVSQDEMAMLATMMTLHRRRKVRFVSFFLSFSLSSFSSSLADLLLVCSCRRS